VEEWIFVLREVVKIRRNSKTSRVPATREGGEELFRGLPSVQQEGVRGLASYGRTGKRYGKKGRLRHFELSPDATRPHSRGGNYTGLLGKYLPKSASGGKGGTDGEQREREVLGRSVKNLLKKI